MIGLPKLWGGADSSNAYPSGTLGQYDPTNQLMQDAMKRYASQQVSSTQQLNIYGDPQQRLLNMIYSRLRLKDGEKHPFEHLGAHESGDKVFVFLVSNGKPAVFEDESAMFPSDALITQLRLVAK